MRLCVAYNDEFARNRKLGIDKSEKAATLCKRKHEASHKLTLNHATLRVFEICLAAMIGGSMKGGWLIMNLTTPLAQPGDCGWGGAPS